ncbi:unnamed protein product [Protopolystoma xenopodis]|uniref:Uncharacterized protein n=1 Tax=Protopolystoma xenopodis TaxID=117903 RepID=A0A3S5B265_9PLAT|nr:unnamed protein product [Protopolystoma xenopodis]
MTVRFAWASTCCQAAFNLSLAGIRILSALQNPSKDGRCRERCVDRLKVCLLIPFVVSHCPSSEDGLVPPYFLLTPVVINSPARVI